MSQDNNPYYDPDDFGLSTVASLDVGGPYEFDIFAVWKDDSGTLYWAADSGCSCPTPFENYNNLSDLRSGSLRSCLHAISVWAESTDATPSQVVGFKDQVRRVVDRS